MSDELTTGGPGGNIPRGWVTSNGYPNNMRLMWIKDRRATDNDIGIVEDKGFTAEPSTLGGILDPDWTAPQYHTPDEMEPWDTFPMYGGKFSANYKFQFLPAGVVTAHPRWWVHQDGKATRAVGGEPVKRVGEDGIYEYHVVDIEITWDAELGVWRT